MISFQNNFLIKIPLEIDADIFSGQYYPATQSQTYAAATADSYFSGSTADNNLTANNETINGLLGGGYDSVESGAAGAENNTVTIQGTMTVGVTVIGGASRTGDHQ